MKRLNEIVIGRRLMGFDQATVADRSRERYRRAALTALASAAARSVGMVTTLVSVPLTVQYLGTERFGLWATMSSLVVMLGVADFGLGYGLVGAISKAHGLEDQEEASRATSSAFFLLTGIALLAGVLFAISYEAIPWSRIFNISSPQAVSEAGPAAAAMIACFLIGLPLGVAQRIQFGYQEGFISSVWAALGSVLTLAGIAGAVWTQAGLQWLVVAAAGGPVVASFLNTIVLFGVRKPWLRPSLARVDGRAARVLLTMGLSFFALQLAMAIGYQTDSIVIAQVIGPDAVTEYTVPLRLFLLVLTFVTFAVAPLWPAYSEAIARGDTEWVRKAMRRSLSSSVFIAISSMLFLTLFGSSLVHAWVGGRISPSLSLLIGLGSWTFLEIVSLPFAMLLNGLAILRFQVACGLSMAIINLPLSIVLAKAIGVSGVVYATVIANLLVMLPLAARVKAALRTLDDFTLSARVQHEQAGPIAGETLSISAQ